MHQNQGILRDFWRFLKARKRWWLLPLLLFLALMSVLILFAHSSALSPYLYAFF